MTTTPSTAIKAEVTAVGRLLKPRNGESHLYKVIAVDAEGKACTLIEQPVGEAE